MNVLNKKGLIVDSGNLRISLDSDSSNCDYSFLSHAHSDHLFSSKNKVVCSEATRLLSCIRGKRFQSSDSVNGVKLLDSGHILGSNSLLIENEKEKLLFTGDFSNKTRSFMKGLKPVKCDALIIESTFGSPFFMFPRFEDEMKRAKDWVDDNIRHGYLSVLMGYPLGKNQELQYYFKDYEKSLEPSIKQYNAVYEDCGIELGNNTIVEESELLFTKPMKTDNSFFNNIRRLRKVRFAVFSGWNLLPYYSKRYNADAGFTVSDHADFKGLLEVVKKSKADTVYVNHGSSETFAKFLRTEGISAVNLCNSKASSSLTPSK